MRFTGETVPGQGLRLAVRVSATIQTVLQPSCPPRALQRSTTDPPSRYNARKTPGYTYLLPNESSAQGT